MLPGRAKNIILFTLEIFFGFYLQSQNPKIITINCAGVINFCSEKKPDRLHIFT